MNVKRWARHWLLLFGVKSIFKTYETDDKVCNFHDRNIESYDEIFRSVVNKYFPTKKLRPFFQQNANPACNEQVQYDKAKLTEH